MACRASIMNSAKKATMSTIDKDQALALARTLGTVAGRDARIDLLERVAELGGFTKRAPGASLNDVVPFESFGETERAILREVAKTTGSMRFARAAGIPIGDADFMAWCGAAPARALEKVVEGSSPSWFVFQRDGLAKLTWSEAREHALAGLGPRDRVWALFLVATGAYGIQTLFRTVDWSEEVEASLRAAGEEASACAQEIAKWVDDADGEVGADEETLGPILRALHAGGKAIPKGLHDFIAWRPENRELLAGIDRDSRAAMVLRVTKRWGLVNVRAELEGIESLADLLATPELVAHLRKIVSSQNREADFFPKLDAIERAIDHSA